MKLIKLAVVHDLPEIFAGDTNPYRGDTSNKEENERKAAEQLFSPLPSPLNERFHNLFDEYLKQESPEAKIVKSADKLLPLIQNICSNEDYSSYRRLHVRYPEVKEYMDGYFKEDGILRKLYDVLLEEADQKGVFYKETDP